MGSYKTSMGMAICADSIQALSELNDNSIDLVITSPPFALLRKKEYGNESQDDYVEWLGKFAKVVYSKLKETGSFVIDIGGAYMPGLPVRSLYNFRIPIYFCDQIGFYLAEDFYWYNPSKLPSPIEWVNKRKIRVKDAVNTVWWFSKTPFPKSDITKVLTPYSDRMKKLLDNPADFFQPKIRPSGHDIGSSFSKDNGGAIPPNLLQIPNTESNSTYLAYCKLFNIKSHPARFPAQLPEFFIKMLTDENDFVVDIFCGSNTTGMVSEKLKRKWLAVDIDDQYLATSVFRFLPRNFSQKRALEIYFSLLEGIDIDLLKSMATPQSVNEEIETRVKSALAAL
jgi:site-specific DNA-methyltransferase (cytosine-N4-specific)